MNIVDKACAYIALGANIGNPLAQIDAAIIALEASEQVTCLALSPVYKSKPHGDIEQPDYLNAAVKVRTTLAPEALLNLLHTIEQQCGRQRTVRWGPRTLDLDLILYDQRVINSDVLTLPHPLAWAREFVIKPLCDLDETLNLPTYGKVAVLLDKLPVANLTEVRHGITYHD